MNPTPHSTITDTVMAIWDTHEAAVRRTIARTTGRSPTDPDVEEAMQMAAEELIVAIADGELLVRPRGWLALVAWQRFSQITNRERRHHQPATQDAHQLDAHDVEDIAVAGERKLTTANLNRTLSRSLGRLTPHQRGILLAYLEERSYEQIAEDRGVSVRSVDKALQRARRRLERDEELRAALRLLSE